MKPEQLRASKEITEKLDKYGIALLWGQVRSGKTRPFLYASKNYNKTLIVTKKDAMSGVHSEADEVGVDVDIINYHSISKMKPVYDLIVFDECHLYISPQQAKPPKIWNACKQFTKDVDIIFCSGTPTAEGWTKLYHMLSLSDDSPFSKYKRFTQWFADYGIPKTLYIGNNKVPCYKTGKKDKIINAVSHLVISLTTKDTGHTHEANDIICDIPMTHRQNRLVELLERDKYIPLPQGVLLGDTAVKRLIKRHQIAGGIGVNLEDDGQYLFKRSEKVEYIKERFNVDTTIILSHYIIEQEVLSKIFPHTGSVTKMSSGVDLSHFENMVIFSMAFSAANYIQVRARMMNINRKTEVNVYYLISGIDKYVYDAVSKKQNFTT